MKFQQPKYQIGDVVYLGTSEWSQQPVTCPDCLGEKHWYVTTPAEETFLTYCRTCWHGFDGCCGTVSDYDYRPVVRRLTIGQVNVRQTDLKAEIQYMCEETGVGSGTCWAEENLFHTEGEARTYGEVQSALRKEKNEDATGQAEGAQRTKDTLILEDSPQAKLRDEVKYLKQQIQDLKRKYVKKKVSKKS